MYYSNTSDCTNPVTGTVFKGKSAVAHVELWASVLNESLTLRDLQTSPGSLQAVPSLSAQAILATFLFLGPPHSSISWLLHKMLLLLPPFIPPHTKSGL